MSYAELAEVGLLLVAASWLGWTYCRWEPGWRWHEALAIVIIEMLLAHRMAQSHSWSDYLTRLFWLNTTLLLVWLTLRLGHRSGALEGEDNGVD